jgi:nucleoside-diphosphate-sugar epimerase
VIVGSGLLAGAFAEFADDAEWVIFASGVSNSQAAGHEGFEREERLLEMYLSRADQSLVYFSSCGLVDGDTANSPYMRHKKRMEARVLSVPGSVVFRLPQLVGPTSNPHTLVNYLRDKIATGARFELWTNAERNIVDVEDVVAIAGDLLRGGQVGGQAVNIATSRSLPMPEIVQILERVMGKRGNYSLVPRGAPFRIDTTLASQSATRLGIDFGEGYLERAMTKYYGRGHGSHPLNLVHGVNVNGQR